jgi:energy-coupling factor transporter ATP-binding protein EcfA2
MNARVAAAEKRVAESFVPKIYEGSFWLDTAASKRRVLVSVEEGALLLDGSGLEGGVAPSAHEAAAQGVLLMGKRTSCATPPQTPSAINITPTDASLRTLKFPKLDIENSSHIGVHGPNGSGKSTFLRYLASQLPLDIPTMYMPQELSSAESRQILAELKTIDQVTRGKLLSLVARLNSDPDRILSGQTLSPGELRKIMLAQGVLMQKPQLIIMDEPTNHLDLQSIEALEAVLADCPCALVLVSHDKLFLAKIASQFWRFTTEGNVLVEY